MSISTTTKNTIHFYPGITIISLHRLGVTRYSRSILVFKSQFWICPTMLVSVIINWSVWCQINVTGWILVLWYTIIAVSCTASIGPKFNIFTISCSDKLCFVFPINTLDTWCVSISLMMHIWRHFLRWSSHLNLKNRQAELSSI